MPVSVLIEQTLGIVRVDVKLEEDVEFLIGSTHSILVCSLVDEETMVKEF